MYGAPDLRQARLCKADGICHTKTPRPPNAIMQPHDHPGFNSVSQEPRGEGSKAIWCFPFMCARRLSARLIRVSHILQACHVSLSLPCVSSQCRLKLFFTVLVEPSNVAEQPLYKHEPLIGCLLEATFSGEVHGSDRLS
jgi:hypothetical protein